MQRYFCSRVFGIGLLLLLCSSLGFWYFSEVLHAGALNVHTYSDLISDSRPGGDANHTFTFEIKQAVAPGGYFDFDFPTGFVLPATSTFDVRNVEMRVNGVPRVASDTLSAAEDQVVITTGNGGAVRYNLNTSTGISADSDIEFRIGNHTSNSLSAVTTYSTSTGTTTSPADIVPITNPSAVGNQEIYMTVGGTSETTYAEFLIRMIAPISIAGVDTTEEVPPFRFNGAPSGTIGGTTLFVEMSLETDEFAICKYSQTASTSFAAMTDTFENSGILFHSQLVTV